MEGEEERAMGEDESKDNSQTEAATDETTRLADRKSVLKLLSLDQWEGVMLTMTRRKNVKNRQLGVCGDMHVCHHQCMVTIRKLFHLPTMLH